MGFSNASTDCAIGEKGRMTPKTPRRDFLKSVSNQHFFFRFVCVVCGGQRAYQVMSAPPPGILPIYLRSAMVEQYGLIDENKQPVIYKKISKEQILDDIQRQGVYNDFSEIKAKLVVCYFALLMLNSCNMVECVAIL
jgi:hypothetical protein